MKAIRNAARHVKTETSTIGLDGQKSVRPGQFLIPGQDGQPHFSEWSTERAIREGYTIEPPLFACIDRIMKGVISVRWYTAIGDPNDDKDNKEIPHHPLTQLIYAPNPYMTYEQMFQYATQHMYLGGNALWSKTRVTVGGRPVPVELWPISPDKIKPIPGRRNFIEAYALDKSILVSGKDRIPVEDVIHWQFSNPSDPYWGIAPVKALAHTIDTDVEALRWNLYSMANRARASGILSFDDPLTEEQWQEARSKVRASAQGVENAHGIMIMPRGIKFTPWSLTAQEMDFIASRKHAREDICAVHGLMPPAIGYMEDATLANVDVADRAVWHNAIIPFLKILRSQINRSLAPEFGPNVTIEYDLSNIEVLQDGFEQKVQTAERLFKMGVPFNQINHRLKLEFPDIPGGHHSYLPINIIPQPESTEDHPGVSQRRPLRNGNDGDDDDVRSLLSLPSGSDLNALRIIDKGTSPSDVSTNRADEDESWSRPTLSDFTDKSWNDLTASEKRRIAGHYAYSRTMPPETFGDLALPHHRPSDGAIVWRGVAAAAARFNQADIPADDRSSVKAHIRRHYRTFGREDEIPDVIRD